MVYEHRVYRCMPGKLPELNKRFESVTLKIWQKHGIRALGFWTVLVGASNQELHYLLEWRDLAERERLWNAFQSDPQWIQARAETEKNGPIVANITNTILAPTAYSPLR
jgi:hypothetical protein